MNKKINSTTICQETNRAHITITLKCNNNCIFCLQGHHPNINHRSFEDIKIELDEAIKSKVNKIILSGGEPTIHPDFLKIVNYCTKNKVKQVQAITNGRMFSNLEFLDKAIKAGLTEITLSIHGANEKTHDSLVNVPGAFNQIKKAISNIKQYDVVTSIDFGIFKQNYKELPDIIELIYDKFKIKGDIDLIGPVYQGNAQKNDILPEHEKVEPFLKKALQKCKEKKAVCWVLRIPLKYMAGYEIYKQDTNKLIEQALSMASYITKFPAPCKGIKCNYCRFLYICNSLEKIYPTIARNEKTNSDINIIIKSENDELKNICFTTKVTIKNIQNVKLIEKISNKKNIIQTQIDDIYNNETIKKIQNKNITFNYHFVSFNNEISDLFDINYKQINTSKMNLNKQKITIILTKKNIKQLEKLILFFIKKNFKTFEFKNFNPQKFIERKINWNSGMEIFDKYNLIPNYNCFEKELKKATKILDDQKIDYFFQDIPYCIFSENFQKQIEKKLNTDTFLSEIPLRAIKDNHEIDFNELTQHITKKTYKEKIKKCENCKYNKKCAGFFDSYLKLNSIPK